MLTGKCETDTIHGSRKEQYFKKKNKAGIWNKYKVGNQIITVQLWSERNNIRKSSSPSKGPYHITKVNKNGTVEIERWDSLKDLVFDSLNHTRGMRIWYNWSIGGEYHAWRLENRILKWSTT